MFLELEGKNTFKDNYFEMLKYRLAFGSLELEGIDGDLADINQSIKIYNQLNAINYIFEKNPKCTIQILQIYCVRLQIM